MLRVLVISEGVKRHGSVKTVNSLMMEVTVGDEGIEAVIERLTTGFGHPDQWGVYSGTDGTILTFTVHEDPMNFTAIYDKLFEFAGVTPVNA